MAFNKKSNVAQYRSFKCIRLLILCITCLLSLNLSLNASAIRNINNLRRTYVKQINFNTYAPDNTYTNQTIRNYVYSNIYTASINSNATFRVSSLVINLYDTISYNKNDNWDISIYIYTFMDAYRGVGGETLIPTVLCPSFSSNGNIIDDCSIEYHDIIDSPIDLNDLGNNNYAIQNKIHGYYAVKLNGHFTSDGSGNAMDLSGPLIAVRNSASLALDLDYIFGFSTLRVYEEQESAEEEAAEKELQGTTNIENQSTNDVSNPTNQQTTSLVGTISSFVSAFSNISPAANCNLTLPFPEFLGGDTTVNICTGADKAPTLIAAGSSLLLIITFIPLAFIMLRMIYNEIRSFTNG